MGIYVHYAQSRRKVTASGSAGVEVNPFPNPKNANAYLVRSALLGHIASNITASKEVQIKFNLQTLRFPPSLPYGY